MLSLKVLLSLYINRFKAINQQMYYAQLELSCNDWKVTVYLNNDLDKTVDSDVLKKNINTSQFARLERKAETLAEKATVET